MPIIRVDALADERVAGYREVAEPELVRSRGLFVAEGRLVVSRLLHERRFALQSLLLSETAWRALEAPLAALDSSVPVYVSSAEALSGLVGFPVHRGCLALVERPQARPLTDVVRDARTVIVAESLADPGNVGGLFRNALAFGAGAVLLSPACCDPLYRKAVRTSMAATIRVPFARCETWPADLEVLRAEGFTLVALTPRAPAIDLEALVASRRPSRIALLVGTEGEGLTGAVEGLADLRVRIPISPDVDSLNVAMAAGIALYRLSVAPAV